MSEYEFEDSKPLSDSELLGIHKGAFEKVKEQVIKNAFIIPLAEAQRIPTAKEERDIVKYLAYNGLVLILDYGGDLISLVSPFAAKAWKAFIKWKFNWTPKELPIKDLLK